MEATSLCFNSLDIKSPGQVCWPMREGPSLLQSCSLLSLSYSPQLSGSRWFITTMCPFQQQRRKAGHSSNQQENSLDVPHNPSLWSGDSHVSITTCKGDWKLIFFFWVAMHPAKNCISLEAGERQSEGIRGDGSQIFGSLLQVSHSMLLF